MAELPKTYEAAAIDSKWYQFWESGRYFSADPSSPRPPFCIIMPPPNITGVLHMGHALVNTLQDILVRWKRMSGFETLWIPGTDHAGIATQTVVERELLKTHGKKRTEFTQSEFVAQIWDWKNKNESQIIQQIKRLGSSCDWSKLRFTMDEVNNRAVRKVFKLLFDQGLIYRGDYLVNWDPVTQTALSDDEVEHEERASFLWHIKYPLADGSGTLTIATTRPETMLGDTAVAVSPEDPRYAHLIGRQVRLPLSDRLIPIIADTRVDPLFGTGALKITPGHDPLDYQIGLAHQLPFLNILTPHGRINALGGKFEGLSVTEAREKVVAALAEGCFLDKIEPHLHRVGLSYRSKAVVEPCLSKQWFIKMDGFGRELKQFVKTGAVKLIPSHWEHTYAYWIDHLRDWCISRQLWWGHQIPIWYHKEDPERMICYDGPDLPPEVEANPLEWKRETDVLDTWFSSALWPFSTLGWPDPSALFDKFYPNAVLVTGHDILFFWVARMLMMGKYATGTLPFPETFLHGLIYGKSYWRNKPDGGASYIQGEEKASYDTGKPIPSDVFSKWEKMSKTKGNIIDPIEMIETYGTDAVRMALCASANQARQIDLDRRKFEEFKNFTNKLWNGARFVLMHLEGDSQKGTLPLRAAAFSKGLDPQKLLLEDRWILALLGATVKKVNEHLEAYLFDQAALEAYNFFWKEFCAYYVEIAKPVLSGRTGDADARENKQKVLVIVLCQAIRLLHPIAPFVTEELFHILKARLEGVQLLPTSDPYTEECVRALQASACIVAPYPKLPLKEPADLHLLASFSLMEELVYTIRNVRGEMKLPPSMATPIYLVGDSQDPEWKIIQENQTILFALVPMQEFHLQEEDPKLPSASIAPFHRMKLLLPLPEALFEQEKSRLLKEKEKILSSIEKSRTQLENEAFISRAPPPLVEKLKQQLIQGNHELEMITNKLRFFECHP